MNLSLGTMVNLPPDPNDRPSRNRILDFDETVAVIVTFLVLGTVLFWGLTRGSQTVFQSLGMSRALENPLLLGPSPAEVEAEASDRPTQNRVQQPTGDLGSKPTTTRELEIARPESRRIDAGVPVLVPIETEQDRPVAPGGVTEAPSAESSPLPLSIADVPADYWAYPFIASLYQKGFLPDFPEGQFQPEKPVTRAEFAALLSRSFVQNEPTQRSLRFTDVPSSYWAADAIQQVVGAGYMVGYPDGSFDPDKLMPRYQVLVTLANSLNLASPVDPQQVLNRFQGTEDLPDWSRNQVAAAAGNGLVVSHPDPQNLAPQQAATRAEIAAMLHQALQQQGRVEAIESPFVAPGN